MKLVIIRQLNGFDPYIQAILEFDLTANDIDEEIDIEFYLTEKADNLIREVKQQYPEFCAANFHKRFVRDEDDQ
jgi:hypothetical protein